MRKFTSYYSLVWGLPIHDGPESTYWAYTDAGGKQVKHGPAQTFYGNGRVEYETYFLDGKESGTGTRRNPDGEITAQTFWRTGTVTGWANYDHGALNYEVEAVFEDDHKVATKKFEHDHWSLEFVCGAKIDMAINPQNGELSPLALPQRIACD